MELDMRIRKLALPSILLLIVSAAALAGGAQADSPPVGALPPGPTSTVSTQKGELVAFALPRRSGGRVWRVARRFDTRVVRQVSEADVGPTVVLVFRAVGGGTTTVSFGLTRGETPKAFETRRFVVRVR
jgi:hypothetical protein